MAYGVNSNIEVKYGDGTITYKSSFCSSGYALVYGEKEKKVDIGIEPIKSMEYKLGAKFEGNEGYGFGVITKKTLEDAVKANLLEKPFSNINVKGARKLNKFFCTPINGYKDFLGFNKVRPRNLCLVTIEEYHDSQKYKFIIIDLDKDIILSLIKSAIAFKYKDNSEYKGRSTAIVPGNSLINEICKIKGRPIGDHGHHKYALFDYRLESIESLNQEEHTDLHKDLVSGGHRMDTYISSVKQLKEFFDYIEPKDKSTEFNPGEYKSLWTQTLSNEE